MFAIRKFSVLCFSFLFCSLLLLSAAGCGRKEPTPELKPQEIQTETPNWNNTSLSERVRNYQTEPTITLYRSATGTVNSLPLEEYIMGVVAAEIGPDFPEEAMKAQAIVARSMTLALIELEGGMQKKHGADASDDHTEFQAYQTDSITPAIRSAVEATRGIILTANGDFAYTLFHSVSDGMTASIEEALPNLADTVSYLQPVKTEGILLAPEKYRSWQVRISNREAAAAFHTQGEPLTDLIVHDYGPSGRAITLSANHGKFSASAVDFRKTIGFDRLYSTIFHSIRLEKDTVVIDGAGWGHGAGMEQWGACRMALDGADAFSIVRHYYPQLQLTQLYAPVLS